MNAKLRIWVGGVCVAGSASLIMLALGGESATLSSTDQFQQSSQPRGIFKSALPSDSRASLSVQSAYLRRTKEGRHEVTQASASPLKIQLAAAVREADLPALVQFLNYEFGKDSEADALLIEATRKLALSGRPELVKLAESKISDFVAFERSRATKSVHSNGYAFGNLVHLAEALQDFRGPAAGDSALSLLQDQAMPRVVRGAAALSLGEMGNKGARGALVVYRDDLDDELADSKSDPSEREFILGSLRELDAILARLQ
jgi:hypothetical protein